LNQRTIGMPPQAPVTVAKTRTAVGLPDRPAGSATVEFPSGGRHEAAGEVVDAAPPIGRQEAIRRQAYALWERDGRPDGKDVEHWLRAERLVAAA
jgi:hypothetical protein